MHVFIITRFPTFLHILFFDYLYQFISLFKLPRFCQAVFSLCSYTILLLHFLVYCTLHSYHFSFIFLVFFLLFNSSLSLNFPYFFWFPFRSFHFLWSFRLLGFLSLLSSFVIFLSYLHFLHVQRKVLLSSSGANVALLHIPRVPLPSRWLRNCSLIVSARGHSRPVVNFAAHSFLRNNYFIGEPAITSPDVYQGTMLAGVPCGIVDR